MHKKLKVFNAAECREKEFSVVAVRLSAAEIALLNELGQDNVTRGMRQVMDYCRGDILEAVVQHRTDRALNKLSKVTQPNLDMPVKKGGPAKLYP